MKTSRSQTGFAHILLLVLVLVIMSAAGYYALKAHKTATTSPPTAPRATPLPSTTKSPTASSSPVLVDAFGQKVPADFAAYINSLYETKNQACTVNSNGALHEGFDISEPVVRDSYALVGEGCGAGAAFAYAKVNDNWTEAFSFQNPPSCSNVDRYSFTKELIKQCWTTDNKLASNTNP